LRACWPESTAYLSMRLIDFRRCSISRAAKAISVPPRRRRIPVRCCRSMSTTCTSRPSPSSAIRKKTRSMTRPAPRTPSHPQERVGKISGPTTKPAPRMPSHPQERTRMGKADRAISRRPPSPRILRKTIRTAANRAEVTRARQTGRAMTCPRIGNRATSNRRIARMQISPRIRSRCRISSNSISDNKRTMGVRAIPPKISRRTPEVIRRILRNNHRANPPHPQPGRAENKTPRTPATTNSPFFHPSGANGSLGFRFTLAAP
jgi:hypothetical protein